ncbi:MAG: 30S ribosomal protein S4 [ANME-2 cluster archaeon]|nr:30S ribosomal protein S4 [ANME-2 cluster archaeon]MBC2700391.1 30S ribosomal protein S4 [ANME-2 cluster archaeon]MBC2706588.1 30S ribosomal protein S4 [ANME-2 cluster archaeon]MBC2748030.1 30S ribosomal protein S4 [ANME-2 cluster archaeon]
MGYPGKNTKSYDTPRHPWQAVRLAEEVGHVKTYGLRNKREVWKAQSMLRNYRRSAMEMLAEITEGELIGHVKRKSDDILAKLKRYGILSPEGGLDDILALDTRNFLDRRLQTQVYRQGFANTLRQARQFITHGHIAIEAKKITVPGYMVTKEEELKIEYYLNSPLKSESHVQRPAQIVQKEIAQIEEVQEDRRRGRGRRGGGGGGRGRSGPGGANRGASGTAGKGSGNRSTGGTASKGSGNRSTGGTASKGSGNRSTGGTASKGSGNRSTGGTASKGSGNRSTGGTASKGSGNRSTGDSAGKDTKTSGEK